MEVECYLCGAPDASRVAVDHGNRLTVRCPGPGCGNYIITQHALRRLEQGGPNREVLAELAYQASSRARILDIYVAGDGLLQAVEMSRDGQAIH